MEFFHSIITMSKVVSDSGEVTTSFQVVELHGNKSFVEFYPSEMKIIDISVDVCSVNEAYFY